MKTLLTIAPLGRDADVACDLLTRAGILCRTGRGIEALDDVALEDLSALVLTEEALTPDAVTRLGALLDAQPAWSSLRVVLLVDAEDRRTRTSARCPWRSLSARPGTIVLQRPMRPAEFVSVVAAAVDARVRQFRLRDELEARRRAKRRAQTLAAEMKHRVKNAFAVASSIASQTFRQAETLDEACEAFSGRLASMARAQDLIAEEGTDEADLRQLVDLAVEPYRSGSQPGRFRLEGPHVCVSARQATAFAMAFHELSTNAVKYGALGSASGHVAIRWRIEETADGDTLLVDWREHGGPPVSPPQRRGFGSRLVEGALSQDLGGSAQILFEPAGIICTIRAVLDDDRGPC